MATHRSLNKLEFKAHMSMHNFVEVPEEEVQGSNSTRDRFGKKHNLNDADGKRRLPLPCRQAGAGSHVIGHSKKILLFLGIFYLFCQKTIQ